MSETVIGKNAEIIAQNRELVERLLQQADIPDAPPILLEGFTSGNNLPVYIGLRKIKLPPFYETYAMGLFELLHESGKDLTRPLGWIELSDREKNIFSCSINSQLRHPNTLTDDQYFYLLKITANDLGTFAGVCVLPQHQKRSLGTKLLQLGYTLGSALQRSEFHVDFANRKTQAIVAKSGLEDIPELRRTWSATDTMSYVFGY